VKSARPSPPPPERFDEVAYRDALLRLGLAPPVDLDQVHRAYRRTARRDHPDLAPEGPEREEATRRIQRINTARDYVVRHHAGYVARSRARDASADRVSWWLLPVAAVHAMASVVALGPVLLASRVIGARGRARWRGSRLSRPAARAWHAWRTIGPHVAALGLFFVADGLVVRGWFGGSFLLLASADLVSYVTGEKNEIRGRAAVARIQGLLREAEKAL